MSCCLSRDDIFQLKTEVYIKYFFYQLYSCYEHHLYLVVENGTSVTLVVLLFWLKLHLVLVGEGDYMVVKILMGKRNIIFHITIYFCWPLLRYSCLSLVFDHQSVQAASCRMPHLYFIDFQGGLALNTMFQLLLVRETVLLFLQHLPRHPIQPSFHLSFAILQGSISESRSGSLLSSDSPNLCCGFYCPLSFNCPSGSSRHRTQRLSAFQRIHPSPIHNCICFSTDSFFIHIPRNLLLNFFFIEV